MDKLSTIKGIIKAFKNFYVYPLDRLGLLRKSVVTYHLRNGVEIKAHTKSLDKWVIAEIWALNHHQYFPPRMKLRKNSVVIDIGAHIGAFSIFAAKSGERIKVYAFEPVPENFHLLTENIRINKLQNQIKAFEFAVSGAKGHETIFLSDTATNSMFIDKGKGKIDVESLTLNDIFDLNNLDQCGLLKLDCEGAEYEILFNTPKDYLQKIDVITMEFHHFDSIEYNCLDLKRYLQNLGFEVEIVRGNVSTHKGTLRAKNKYMHAWKEHILDNHTSKARWLRYPLGEWKR